MTHAYAHTDPPRSDIDDLTQPTLLEFGSNTCGICSAAKPAIAAAMAAHPGVGHIKVEDGSGRKLGRSFGVKLWPTLIFLSGGKEVARLVRPRESEQIEQALGAIDVGTAFR